MHSTKKHLREEDVIWLYYAFVILPILFMHELRWETQHIQKTTYRFVLFTSHTRCKYYYFAKNDRTRYEILYNLHYPHYGPDLPRIPRTNSKSAQPRPEIVTSGADSHRRNLIETKRVMTWNGNCFGWLSVVEWTWVCFCVVLASLFNFCWREAGWGVERSQILVTFVSRKVFSLNETFLSNVTRLSQLVWVLAKHNSKRREKQQRYRIDLLYDNIWCRLLLLVCLVWDWFEILYLSGLGKWKMCMFWRLAFNNEMTYSYY